MGDMNFPDPNTTTEHDGWDWDSEKWTKWGSSGGSSKPEGYDDTKAIASGAMATGEMVVLNDDGTVSVVDGTLAVGGAGTPEVFYSGFTDNISSTYDSANNKVVIAYKDNDNSGYGAAVVGAISGDTITFGAPVVFSSSGLSEPSITYDSTANKVVIAYHDNGNYKGIAVVGAVSGDSITFGSPVMFNSNQTLSASCTYDPVANKVVIAYQDNGSSKYGKAVLGTVSGNSISYGTPVVFNNKDAREISIGYEPAANKVVIAYAEDNSYYGTAVVGTVSGDSMSFGTPVVFNNGAIGNMSFTYDSIANRVVLSYSDNGNSRCGTAVVGAVSGNTIIFGTPVVFNTERSDSTSAAYDPVANKVFIAYQDFGNSVYGTVVAGTVSGNSITFDTPEVLNGEGKGYLESTYDPVGGKVVISYKDEGNSNYGTAVTYVAGGATTNLTDSNFIGVSTGDYADGSEATVQIAGINADQQGMTVGKQYILPDGSLDITEGNPSVLAGTAISSTELNIKDTV